MAEQQGDVAGGARPDDEHSAMGRRRAAARDGGRLNYQVRREEIIGAAAQVFADKGYRGTTLADVAEAVGADRATLYYYVGSKEELLDAVVTDVVKDNLTEAERIRDSDAPVPDKLRLLVQQLMDSYAAHYPFLYVYLQENLAHVAEKRRPWAQEMRAVNRRYEAAVEAIISEGIADGTVRAVTDARVLAYGLLGMVSWTNRWFDPRRSTHDAAVIGRAYADVLLHGMVAPTGSSGPEVLADGGAAA